MGLLDDVHRAGGELAVRGGVLYLVRSPSPVADAHLPQRLSEFRRDLIALLASERCPVCDKRPLPHPGAGLCRPCAAVREGVQVVGFCEGRTVWHVAAGPIAQPLCGMAQRKPGAPVVDAIPERTKRSQIKAPCRPCMVEVQLLALVAAVKRR